MTTNNARQAKSAKEELLKLLETKPKFYADAVKYAFACHFGIRLSSLFEDRDFSKIDRKAVLMGLQEIGFFRLENDAKEDSEVIVHLTKQGRDEIIDLFYSGKEKRQLKRLLQRIDAQLQNPPAKQKPP